MSLQKSPVRWLLTSKPSQYPAWIPPTFLCPALLRAPSYIRDRRAPIDEVLSHPSSPGLQRKSFHTEGSKDPVRRNVTAPVTAAGLPFTCPGCGAFSQTQHSDRAGYYDLSSKRVKSRLKKSEFDTGANADSEAQGGSRDDLVTRKEYEQGVFAEALESLDGETRAMLDSSLDEPQGSTEPELQKTADTPICDRCHALVNHNQGTPIAHPNIAAIRDVLSESPHKRNHIYHVVDAVDFPMSLIKDAQSLMEVATRGRNRRSRISGELYAGRPSMSFIITRADLLVPTKEQADKLLAPLRDILQEALGKKFRDVRIGQVRCISAMRGWWTKPVRSEIADFRGGCWMMGKVNVGKSKLIEAVFPKGGSSVPDLYKSQTMFQQNLEDADVGEADVGLVLPPSAPETAYPVMPTISHLPGTTAQPIRMRYGNGRGEVIDLPGLDRHDLMPYVRPEKQAMLIMQSRIKAEQQIIRPGQSLMIGDLVRITPSWPAWNDQLDSDGSRNGSDPSSTASLGARSPDVMVMLAAAFVPFKTNVTATAKGIACQAGERSPGGAYEQLLMPGMGERVASAGRIALRWDVTRQRAGPLTRKDAAGLRPDVLPFVVCSAEVVIEGVGWVELAVQLRRRVLDEAGVRSVAELPAHLLPHVEVFAPDGARHVQARSRPLSLYVTAGRTPKPRSQRSQRPRRSMKGAKKGAKNVAKKTERQQQQGRREHLKPGSAEPSWDD